MSDADKNNKEDIVLQNYHPVVRTKSQEKTPTKSESQSIIINFYSGNCVQKTDKLIQTEPSESSELSEISVDLPEVCTEKKKSSSTAVHRRSQPKNNSKPEAKRSVTPLKKASRFMSDDRREEKSMDSRGRPIKGSARVASDLERKRLEVELKAAEEIARLKQSIIEKRLALELATIQDGAEYPVKMHNPTPQVELRALEEFAMRKQSLIETNLAQELETLEYQNRMQPAPRPSPPPTPSPPLTQKQPAPSPPKLGAFKTESSSSVMNAMRGIGMLDKKLNLDRRFSGHSGLRSPSPINFLAHNDIRYSENRPKKEETPGNYPSLPDSGHQSSKEQSHKRARMAWKFATAKIKKTLKSKSSSKD